MAGQGEARPAKIPPAIVEADLLARANRGRPDAWEALLLRYYPNLVAYARLRIADIEECDKAVAQAFAQLHSTIAKTDPPASVALFRFLRRALADHPPPAREPSPLFTTSDGQVLPPDPCDDGPVVRRAFTALN
ncbi:MAG: RNA polymerase sigma factor, partial [Pseudonocardiaceae bacterium]